jgi:hypothetical protein
MLLSGEIAPYLKDSLQERYGLVVDGDDVEQLSALTVGLSRIPQSLVLESGIKLLGFEDLGESREYYPNHGYYVGNKLILNTRLLEDPQVFLASNGRSLNRFEHTLFHELGHGWDEARGLLSEKPEWLVLSGWSKDPQAGLERITIKEDGVPDTVGEWYHSPVAGFPRFYARRNPWDDFADCFAFYVGGLSGFLPASKIHYLDTALGRYWVGQ